MNRAFNYAFCLVGTMVLSACSTVESPQLAQGMAQDSTRIELTQALHFSSPDGGDVVVPAGAYRLEQAGGSQMRFVPTGDAPRTVVGAEAQPSDLDVSAPIALAIRSEQQPDAYHLVLLLPGRTALDAIGSVSGVRPRGVFDWRIVVMPQLTAQFDVRPGPDLWLRSLSRPCPQPGNVFFVVINSGTETAGPSTARVDMGTRSATVPTNALAPGQSQGYSAYDSCSAIAGHGHITCSVSVTVDVLNAVAESHELNNTRTTKCTD